MKKLTKPRTIYGEVFCSAVKKLTDPSASRQQDALKVLKKMKGWRWVNDTGHEPVDPQRITDAFDRAVDALDSPSTPEADRNDHLRFLQFLAGGPELRAEILKSLDKAKGGRA